MRKYPAQRQQRRQTPAERVRVCISIDEFVASTGISKPSAYRMMADGRLHYVQIGKRMRKIPKSEYERLGLVSA